MKCRKTPTRLELHRLKFHRDGGKGVFLNYEQLDPAEKHMLSQEVFSNIYLDGHKRDPYSVWAEVFLQWGVMCPHPQTVRLYGGKEYLKFPSHSHRWYTCEACGCSVKNEDFSEHREAFGRG